MTEKKILDPKDIKKSFRKNTIKLILWCILLGICFVYLQRNPAEKISILGSYKTISQNIEVFFSNIFSDNGALLKQVLADILSVNSGFIEQNRADHNLTY